MIGESKRKINLRLRKSAGARLTPRNIRVESVRSAGRGDNIQAGRQTAPGGAATRGRVVIRGLVKNFGDTRVLKGVDLDIGAGEFITVLGPSGCGKTTLMRIIAGLERQDAGSVEIDGRPVDALRPNERDIAMVFQSYALYPHLTVFDNIALPLRMRRLNWRQRLPGMRGIDRTAQASTTGSRQRSAKSRRCCRSNRCSTESPRSSRAARSSAWRWDARWCASRACS